MSNPIQTRGENEAAGTQGFPRHPDGISDSAISRRRLIRFGSAAVPVAATLFSKPVLAATCNSTSAWGSAQINPNASTTARNISGQLTQDSWTISNWADNTNGAPMKSPWQTLGLKTEDKFIGKNGYYKDYKVSDLYGGGTYPLGLSATDGVWARISTGNELQKHLLVARLNANLIQNVQACLTSDGQDQLPLMSNGTYTPANLPGTTWNSTQIIQYLSENYIAR